MTAVVNGALETRENLENVLNFPNRENSRKLKKTLKKIRENRENLTLICLSKGDLSEVLTCSCINANIQVLSTPCSASTVYTVHVSLLIDYCGFLVSDVSKVIN